jgi:hypothetical protein
VVPDSSGFKNEPNSDSAISPRNDKKGGHMTDFKTRLDIAKEALERSLSKAIEVVADAQQRLDLIRATHKKDQEATQKWAQEIEKEAGL